MRFLKNNGKSVPSYTYKDENAGVYTGEELIGIFSAAREGKQRKIYNLYDLQIFMRIYSFRASFEAYVAFDRRNAMPVLVEKIDRDCSGVTISFEQYTELLIGLDWLLRAKESKNEITVTVNYGYTLQKLMRINSANIREHILPFKKISPDYAPKDTETYDITFEELSPQHTFNAVYQGREYTLSYPTVRDGVLLLSDENGKSFFVEAYEVTDIYKKEYYIESKNKLFKVELAGGNAVIVEYKNGEYYESYGFRRLDPRGMGPGWEVEKKLIDAVKYRKKSKYETILKNLERWENCGLPFKHDGTLNRMIEQNVKYAEIWEDLVPKAKAVYKEPWKNKNGKDIFYPGFRCDCFKRGSDIYDAEYICIDLISGTPYYSHDVEFHIGAASTTEYKQEIISWEKFREYAFGISDETAEHFKGINENNWKNYLNPEYVRFMVF